MFVTVLLLVLGATLQLTGKVRLPLKTTAAVLCLVTAFTGVVLAPAIFLKLISANVFTVVKIDSLFFFFTYYVYSVTVLYPVSGLVSAVASKM